MPLRHTYLLLAALCGLLLTACGPRTIPEDKMVAIIRKGFVDESVYRRLSPEQRSQERTDSLAVYLSVLGEYGYTLEDFRYTLREMSLRKSNPLSTMLGVVAQDIQAVSALSRKRYDEKLRLDTLAMDYASDTIWRRDTVITGRWNGYTFTVHPADFRKAREERFRRPHESAPGPLAAPPADSLAYPFRHTFDTWMAMRALDSLMPAGTYVVQFDYSTGTHARSFTKSLAYEADYAGVQADNYHWWITPAKDTALFSQQLNARHSLRELAFTFKEAERQTGVLPDTLYLTRLRLIYIPPADQVREDYFEYLTGIKPLHKENEQRHFSWPADSLPFYPRSQR